MKEVRIKKDCSGITYEYELVNDKGLAVLSGDGLESEEEIKAMLIEWADIISSFYKI